MIVRLLVLSVPLVLLAACASTAEVSLASLNANQLRWDGEQVRTEGVVATFDEPRHYWIEDDAPNRVELVEGDDPLEGLDELVGATVLVEGRFTFRDDEGRRISVDRLEVVEPAPTAAAEHDAQRFPDVLSAELTPAGDGWTLSATISSPYDSRERYADAFRALAPDGTELGVRVLTHDHANEQPFTRSLTGLMIPDDVGRITVQARDLENGWGGGTAVLAVPR